MGAPRNDESFADRLGTLHSVTVKPTIRGRFVALARICYLTDDGQWKWANRRVVADTVDGARMELVERVTKVLGCRPAEETNRLTGGLHRGHKRVEDLSVLHR